jgi:hypothetical protein
MDRESRAHAMPMPLPDDSNARCLSCGYLLRGLTENRCPECGRPFDPNDPRTVNLGRQVGPVARLWLRPPGWPLNVMCAFWMCVVLWGNTSPGGYFGLQLFGISFGLLVGGVWLLRFVVAWILAAKHHQPTFRPWRASLRWAVMPLLIAIVASSVWTHTPARLCFWISRPCMDRLARQVMSAPATAPRPAWVGLYPIQDARVVPGGMRFIVRGAGFMDRAGFAFSPSGPPPNLGGEDCYTPIRDGWYEWAQGS